MEKSPTACRTSLLSLVAKCDCIYQCWHLAIYICMSFTRVLNYTCTYVCACAPYNVYVVCLADMYKIEYVGRSCFAYNSFFVKKPPESLSDHRISIFLGEDPQTPLGANIAPHVKYNFDPPPLTFLDPPLLTDSGSLIYSSIYPKDLEIAL